MTSKIIVNTIEADTGISSITFASNINLQNDASVLVSSNGVRLGTGSTIAAPSANEITLSTNGTERVRVDSSGNVGIGTDNPEYNLDLGQLSSSTIRLISEDNGTAIRVGAGGDSNDVTLLRVDGTSNGVRYRGESNVGSLGFSIKYMGARFGNNNSLSIFGDNGFSNGSGSQVEAITVLQDGKIGIGTDTPAETLSVAGDVRVQNSTDASQYLTINYQGINFQNTGAGSSTSSSAHLLDDYEEGTWTPVFAGNTTSGTYTYTTQLGRYTKIGNTVTVHGTLQDINTVSGGTGPIRIRGLPFVSSADQVFPHGVARLEDFDVQTGAYDLNATMIDNGTELVIVVSRDALVAAAVQSTGKLSNTADIYVSCTYRSA